MAIQEVVFEGKEYQGWNEWAKKFKPIKNHLVVDPDEQMFETFGDEVDFVKAQDEKYIWTYVDGDMSSLLVAGYHYVNRLGYFIATVPWDSEWDSCLLSVEVECECYDEDAWEWGDPDCQKCEGSGYVTNYVS